MKLDLVPIEPAGTNCLSDAAYDIAERYRNSNADSTRGWERQWQGMIEALRECCPGHTSQEYERALNDGFAASR